VAVGFEEIGWTGYLTPRMLARGRVFMAGFTLGLAWALWHAMVDFHQNFTTMGIVWQTAFAAALWLVVAVVMASVAHGELGTPPLPRMADMHGPA
jgi:membrane protease YdiL (CAAX protease family)